MDDLDELFNDASAGHALRERVEALRLSGCSQTVSWSRHGTIAYITPDGNRVETRHLMCDPHTGRWDISPAYSHPRITATHEGQQLVHITWNMLGAELAVIDVHGRVSIHCVVTAINDMSCVREANRDQEEDMNAIVGFGWLNLDRPYVVYKACVRQERDLYRYPAFQFKANGPFNPHAGRNAGMGITRAGVVKLWYQVEGLYKYQEVTCELEGGMSAEDVFTHASFASDVDSTIVLAAYTVSRKLRVFRIFINWNNNQQQSSQIANAATMHVRRLRVDDLAVPREVEGRDTSSARLTKLEVLPPTPGQKDGQPFAHITILATYVYLGHTNFTVVARWVLQQTSREPNPAIAAMNTSGADLSPHRSIELKRLDDFIIEKCVIEVTAMFATNFVSFICTDGTVDQRERIGFKPFPEPSPNFDELHNMGHAGFRFKAGTEIYKTIGLSPNQCAALRITSDDRVQLACFEQVRGNITDDLMLPMVAAIAQQHAFGCKNGHNNDDLLCAIQNYKSPAFNKLLLRETHRSLSFSLDFTGEQPNEKLFRNPTVQKCLSLQNILDYAGDSTKKSLPAKMAWILLLIRIASFAFGSTVNLFHKDDSEVKAEELQPLIGIAKWTTDLFAYIVDGLFELKRLVKGREKDMDFVRQKAVELNSPALFLVLASGSRVLLRYCSRGLKSLQQKIEQRLKQKNIHDGETYTTLKTILIIFENCPAKVPQFERIITDIESHVRLVYTGIKEEDRGIAERAVFVDNTIPPVFLTPVEFLFRTSLKRLWEETDLDKLHFYDLSWLGLHDDQYTIQHVKKNPIDIIRKTPIRNATGRMIRCVRCCSQIEDGDKHKAWIGNLGRMCVCGSLWMVQEVGKPKVSNEVVVPMVNVGSVGANGSTHV